MNNDTDRDDLLITLALADDDNPDTFGGVYCRLHPAARVTHCEGDLSVSVAAPGIPTVTSLAGGSLSLTDIASGRSATVATAPLYLAAANSQELPVDRIQGDGVSPQSRAAIRASRPFTVATL